MKSQEKRIARFIESLPSQSEVGKDQASLLVTGAGLQVTVNTDCYNSEDCNGSANTGDCKNQSGHCNDTSNQKKCMILPNNCPVNSTTSC